MEDFKDRFDKFMEAFYKHLDRYESEHPDFLQETLREIIGMNLYNLKAAIESPDVPEVSWEKPEMTVQFPVHFDFQKMWPFYAQFSPEDLDKQDAESTAELTWQVRMFYALRAMTLDAAILKQDGKYHFLCVKDRDMLPQEHYRAWKQWEQSGNTVISIPIPLGVDEDTGQELSVTVKVQFWPLEIDKDAGQTYYPVSIWLDSSYPLTELSENDRQEFWTQLLKFFLSSEETDTDRITKARAYYPGPTAIERVQHIFGELLPTQIEKRARYVGPEERHYIYSGVFREKTTEIQLSLPGLESTPETDFLRMDKQIVTSTDALALKTFHAVLAECYRQHKDWGAWCYWDSNTFADLLGYKRDKRGYHLSRNIERIETRLRVLSELTYRFELLGYDPKTEADRIVFEGPLITIEPKQTVSLFKRETRIAKRSTLRIHDELYNNMMNRSMFAWYDKDFLRLNPQKQSRAILLYSYYVAQLAMGARQRKGQKNVVKRPLETVLRETGIKIDYYHKKRDMESFRAAHEELKARGLIEDYLLSGGEIEIVFSQNHPALKKYRRTSINDMIPGSVPGVE